MLQATCPRRKCHIPEDLNLKILISHFGFYSCIGILTTTVIIFNVTIQKLELRNLFYHVTRYKHNRRIENNSKTGAHTSPLCYYIRSLAQAFLQYQV